MKNRYRLLLKLFVLVILVLGAALLYLNLHQDDSVYIDYALQWEDPAVTWEEIFTDEGVAFVTLPEKVNSICTSNAWCFIYLVNPARERVSEVGLPDGQDSELQLLVKQSDAVDVRECSLGNECGLSLQLVVYDSELRLVYEYQSLVDSLSQT